MYKDYVQTKKFRKESTKSQAKVRMIFFSIQEHYLNQHVVHLFNKHFPWTKVLPDEYRKSVVQVNSYGYTSSGVRRDTFLPYGSPPDNVGSGRYNGEFHMENTKYGEDEDDLFSRDSRAALEADSSKVRFTNESFSAGSNNIVGSSFQSINESSTGSSMIVESEDLVGVDSQELIRVQSTGESGDATTSSATVGGRLGSRPASRRPSKMTSLTTIDETQPLDIPTTSSSAVYQLETVIVQSEEPSPTRINRGGSVSSSEPVSSRPRAGTATKFDSSENNNNNDNSFKTSRTELHQTQSQTAFGPMARTTSRHASQVVIPSQSKQYRRHAHEDKAHDSGSDADAEDRLELPVYVDLDKLRKRLKALRRAVKEMEDYLDDIVESAVETLVVEEERVRSRSMTSVQPSSKGASRRSVSTPKVDPSASTPKVDPTMNKGSAKV